MSDSPESLLKSMHLPTIVEQDGELKGFSGNSIVYFINGEKATKIDIATFWPKNVKCVQYIENSKDPKYDGVKTAVNFIMEDYKIGGLTKIKLFQKMPFYGSYALASKLVYKKMTFGVSVSPCFNRDAPSTESNTIYYKDVYYNKLHYDEIQSSNSIKETFKTNYWDATLNAKYKRDNFYMVHTLSFVSNRDSKKRKSRVEYIPSLFDSDNEEYDENNKTFSAQLTGEYYKQFSSKWTLAGGWSYSHGRNNYFSKYQMTNNPEIYNASVEDVNKLTASALATYAYNSKWSYQLKLAYGSSWYSTLYSGTANTKESQNLQNLSAEVVAGWFPTEALNYNFHQNYVISQPTSAKRSVSFLVNSALFH